MPERFGLPRVPSDRRTCGRCQASVWVSKRATLESFTGELAIDGILCVVCAMAVIKPGDTIDAAPWVVEDLAELIEGGSS